MVKVVYFDLDNAGMIPAKMFVSQLASNLYTSLHNGRLHCIGRKASVRHTQSANMLCPTSPPHVSSRVIRIDPLHFFLAGCRTR